ncbi:P-loop containing nucleoside triphosphate hydrolase protein [Zopfia rhizophila CBS 207.26]|uniref:P-loop containing nucleoside triphosphate hydrolase protein n=1 Tax=Zopfia rhizophila CBS 207.26 TaxID=1314779 RepID=A0A6A6EVR6_9PEZI|nr:P-loop containing nucleoside triphosphate hydrolase protein [Zopfia rhizophila CBS 207.26]
MYRLDNDKVCLSEPSWNFVDGKPKTLKAEMPLPNHDLYLEKNADIAFVIYKDYPTAPKHNDGGQDKVSLWEDILQLPDPNSESIKLISTKMRNALQAYLKLVPEFPRYFPGFNVEAELFAPYKFWYYSRPFFANLLGKLEAQHRGLMELLSEWIEANYRSHYQEADTKLAEGLVTAKYLDYLVRPGEVLVSYDNDQFHAYICESWPYGKESDSKIENAAKPEEKTFITTCSVDCWAWCPDDAFHKLERTLHLRIKTKDPAEAIRIQELQVYPLKYASMEVEVTLRTRGLTHWSFRNARLVEYEGERYGSSTLDGKRFMVDFQMYKLLHPEAFSAIKKQSRDSEGGKAGQISEETGPSGDEIYLFPSRVKGFSFRSKKWIELQVDNIRDVQWHKKAFENLVIAPKSKEIIEALITTQLAAEKSTDIILGKGNGLIMLLHGGPGTGKTFTAETVAEFAEKPLYRVTCGDIGTKPEAVEQYLESVLYLGKTWGCLVLLDEADVFLEERGLQDLERNALVSVFLRVLEYYDGILILTSNRVGTFDEAFKSRIQLALHYQALTAPQRKKIWRNFMAWLKDMGESYAVDLEDISDNLDELARHQMNGRQIRNSITTARQLAKFRKKAMSYDDLEHVISVAGEFDKYLTKVREGLSDENIARADGRR